MGLQIRKLGHAFGVQVVGVDIPKLLDGENLAEVRAAFLEHSVLVFRGQPITRAQHLAFSLLFGEVDKNKVILRDEVPGYSEISFVVNKPSPGGSSSETSPASEKNSAFQGRYWHSDKSYTQLPSKATVLRGVELPEVGGDTMFANCYLAYENLSDTMKKVIDGLDGVHIRADSKSTSLDHFNPEKLAETRRLTRTAQPIVRVHPETDRKALYLGENLIKHIAGMTEEESAPLLAFLHKHATRPQFIYRHVWQKDDVVIWDNRCTMHIALGDFDRKSQYRHLEKISVLGTPSGYAYPPQ